MVSNPRNPRPFTDSRETSERTYEDGESCASRATGLRAADPSALRSIRRSYGSTERAELAEVRPGDRGGRGWVRDTFDRWDSMVDEYEAGAAGGADQPDQSAPGAAGE